MFNVNEFIEELEYQGHTPRLQNPYLLPHRSANLRAYLDVLFRQQGRRVLIVGEALGYRGGLHTGIPFSSARLVHESPHPFWRQLRKRLVVNGSVSEATASIVWDYLAPRRRLPLFWNALPFHPHIAHDTASNRTPTAGEINAGQIYLKTLADAWQPGIVAGVGSKGYRAACQALPDTPIVALRHPSYGGKQAFCQGMDRLLR
ncbi:hypothetical protein E2F43_10590 [Seongchinamella unica]|uniref:Uracil-DNA glycosylase-like domain-containing protein n=1 Tax=Seongchinamella unica TaxID=2547392 RepID=A0A4R5LSV4_9GAMM|nr:uracil-DNA glycosylase [Seongchinamella unica]TDG13936.1 hypothetical protein E2F43_10590 [Seongchinamella unica]